MCAVGRLESCYRITQGRYNYDSYISPTCRLHPVCSLERAAAFSPASSLLFHCSGTWVSAAPVSVSEWLCVVQKYGRQCLWPLVLKGPGISHSPIWKLLAPQSSGSLKHSWSCSPIRSLKTKDVTCSGQDAFPSTDTLQQKVAFSWSRSSP